VKKQKDASLDELMVAMDAVDALRHQEKEMARIFNEDQRKERLKAKLREIYAASGIEVSDSLLEAGVDALEKERFAYRAPQEGAWRYMASLYISRKKWLKPLFVTFTMMIIAAAVYYAAFFLPASQEAARLPSLIEQSVERIEQISTDNALKAKAESLRLEAKRALAVGDTERAKKAFASLDALLKRLEKVFRVRIVQEAGKPSGIWRIPPKNPNGRNYYLIVEAVDEAGNKVPWRILNEEDSSYAVTTRWAIRVPEAIYRSVAQDKRDDGIIQKRTVGRKVRGKYEIDYNIPLAGGTITKW
jgi:hypothetical protein